MDRAGLLRLRRRRLARRTGRAHRPDPLDTGGRTGLAALRGALDHHRAARLAEIGGRIADAFTDPAADLVEEDRYLNLRLSTVTGPRLAGQVVTDGDRTVYASLFAR